MSSDSIQKAATNRSEKTEAAPRMPLGRKLLVGIVSMFVATLVGFSLWVSLTAITQKINLSHGTSQIIDIVDMARRVADIEHNLGAAGREDILLRIANMEGSEALKKSDVLKTQRNPWGGMVVAYTISDSQFRIEDIVPPRICSRIIDLLTTNINSLGLQQIDARGENQSWRQIYVAANHGVLSKNQIDAGCRSQEQVVLALTFSLR